MELQTYEDVSNYYDEVLQDVRDNGTQSQEDEHDEVCYMMMQRKGDQIKKVEQMLYDEMDAQESLSQQYNDALDKWSDVHSWIRASSYKPF